MITLIIDSSTKVLYEALVENDKILCENYIEGQNDHAKNIVSTLEKMLNDHHLETDNIDKIVCGIGPGSYTGVRMAVTVAKMLAVFKNIPVYEISTLALISSGSKGRTLAKIDARRQNAFCAVYENGKLISEEKLRPIEAYSKEVSFENVVTESEFKVNPLLCVKLGKLNTKPHSLKPNYLQETEAERNLHHEN